MDGKSDDLAQLIGTLSLMTSLVSLIAVPLLTAASDTRLGRKNVLLLGLALESCADWQKWRFKQDPARPLLRRETCRSRKKCGPTPIK